MKTKIEYKAKGIVLGNCWGGGTGGYSTKALIAPTREALLVEANKKLKDGSLDGGMGFESLKGALLNITKITTKVIGGKSFVNEEFDSELIGDLNESEQDFLVGLEY